MKTPLCTLSLVLLGVALAAAVPPVPQGYVLEHERDLAVEQPGPHEGGGKTTAHNFFATVKDSKLVFRKRILHPGAAIGRHLQAEDEIYYVLSGAGVMLMNGSSLTLGAGDAILTRPGSTHSLRQTGTEDLVIIVSYLKKN